MGAGVAKKIVFFIQNFGRPAGSERVTSIVANHLIDAGYNVSILSICGDNTAYYPVNESIRLYTLIDKPDVDNRKMFFQVLGNLKKFYQENDIDICIDVMSSLSIYTILIKKRFGLKNVTWEHFNFKINTGMCWYGRRFAMRFSDQIVTLTNTDKRYYCNNKRIKSAVEYIYNPTPYPSAMMHNFDNKQIISVGRLNNQKGFDRLIEVWTLVEPETDWELKIYGEGEDYEQLLSKIKNAGLKQIHLNCAVKNIDEQYMNSSLYISTARYEGLPMTMIEAQSFGLPIVSFEYDTGPSEIITDGVDGYILNSDDEQDLFRKTAGKLLELINNEATRKEMSIKAKENSKRFENSVIIKKWLEILEKLE